MKEVFCVVTIVALVGDNSTIPGFKFCRECEIALDMYGFPLVLLIFKFMGKKNSLCFSNVIYFCYYFFMYHLCYCYNNSKENAVFYLLKILFLSVRTHQLLC